MDLPLGTRDVWERLIAPIVGPKPKVCTPKVVSGKVLSIQDFPHFSTGQKSAARSDVQPVEREVQMKYVAQKQNLGCLIAAGA